MHLRQVRSPYTLHIMVVAFLAVFPIDRDTIDRDAIVVWLILPLSVLLSVADQCLLAIVESLDNISDYNLVVAVLLSSCSCVNDIDVYDKAFRETRNMREGASVINCFTGANA